MTPEHEDKMRIIRTLSGQIAIELECAELNEKGHLKFTPASALRLQTFRRRRAELLATMPLRIVE